MDGYSTYTPYTTPFAAEDTQDGPCAGEKPLNIRARTLRDAEMCVNGSREQDYGTPEENLSITAALWSGYLGTKVTALDVSMMMCLLKISRIKNGGGSGDSFVDLAGYAACGAEIWGGTGDG